MDVIIYILCKNEKTLTLAKNIYKYPWAKPILLTNQDFTFENTFWNQMKQLYNEWSTYSIVGTLSYSSYKKININEVNQIIKDKLYLPNKYYHFMNFNLPVPNGNTNTHPHFMDIWNYILNVLKLKTTTENCCNYWMCAPDMMKHFIIWYTNTCFSELMKHPLILSDAKYSAGNMSHKELMQLWGKPYYPHFPFIMERLSKCFFETYYSSHVEIPNNFCWDFYIKNNPDLLQLNKVEAKSHYYKIGQYENRICNNIKEDLVRHNNLNIIVFLISHCTEGGAPNCLYNIKDIFDANHVKTQLIYLKDITFNIVDYILKTSSDNYCSPIVFCNTLVCTNIVYALSKTSILTYWYIHEWYDEYTCKTYNLNASLFNSSIHLIFVCNSSLDNYKKYVPVINNYHIIYNTFSETKLNTCLSEKINIHKQQKDIYIAIIGSVENRKNQQSFIDNVFYKLKNKYANLKLLIVGTIFIELIIQPNYVNDIIITNGVDNALPYIKLSDIIVSYSINEVLPLNLIESLYCGKPIVASNVGGVHEIITNNDNGFLFNVNDHDKCFTILCKLIENKHIRTITGFTAKKSFEKFNNSPAIINKWMSLLNYT